MGEDVAGHLGTVIWCNQPYFNHRTRIWAEWGYGVYFPPVDRYRSFRESDLESTGEVELEAAIRGQRYEISFDTVPIEDMTVVDGKYQMVLPRGEFWFPIDEIGTQEGTYRVPGQFWQVFIFSKLEISEPRHHFGTWESGITGVEIEVPNEVILYRDYMIGIMSKVFDTEPESWVVVSGLDSLLMK